MRIFLTTSRRSLTRRLALTGLLGILGPAAHAQLATITTRVDLPNTSSGTITSFTLFTFPFVTFPSPVKVTTIFDGAFSSLRGNTMGALGGSASMAAFGDESGVPFATTTPLGSVSFIPIGGLTDSFTSTQVVHGWNPTGPIFTLTHKYVLVVPAHTAFHGQIFSTVEPDTAIGTVPEPGEWAAMGILAGGLGALVVGQRRRNGPHRRR